MAIKNKVNISERSISANERLEFGHFEADKIFSCKNSIFSMTLYPKIY